MPAPDILTRLRAAAGTAYNIGDKNERLSRYKLHMGEAADEIERLRRELDEAKKRTRR